jgi:cytochrome c oxidase cbb3-type subunit IV
MLKFIKHHLTEIEGIEVYPMISLTIFTVFFAVLLYRVFTIPKEKINEISNYPVGNDKDLI